MIVLIFILLLTATAGVFLYATREPRLPAELGRRVEAIRLQETLSKGKKNSSDVKKGLAPEKLQGLAAKTKAARGIGRLILQSGTATTPGKLVLSSLVAGASGAFIARLFLHLPMVVPAGMILGGMLPYMRLRLRRKRRLQKFEDALPEAITLMARSLRAGHSVSSALEIIGEQGAAPLSDEFRQVSQQQRLGAMFRDTLFDLADRVPSQDLRFLITAIMVQRENGGDLTEVLDRAAKVISERLRIAGEVRIYSAQGRLTGWILSALPVVLLLIINVASPGYTEVLFNTPTGRHLLYGAGASILMGIFMIRKIVDIKV